MTRKSLLSSVAFCYPLEQETTAKPMEFPETSEKSLNMLPRSDISAFAQLKDLLDVEGTGLADPDWLGMLDAIGITAGKSFADDKTRAVLEAAAKTGYKTSRVIGFEKGIGGADFRVYEDRKWLNPINNVTGRWPNASIDLGFKVHKGSYRALDPRIWFFTDYYSISPGMVSMTPGKGAFYMIGFEDKDGDPLDGENSYKVNLPKDIPVELFWSVTLYEAENASGLDNGQPFPSLGKLNKSAQNADGSTDIYISPKRPRVRKATRLRPFRVRASSPSCAFTLQHSQQSMEAGSRATSKR